MPWTNSSNVTGTANEQPEYSVGWHPYAIDTDLSAAIAVGSVLMFTSDGVGATPGPGGDAASGTGYTVQCVEAMIGTTAANFCSYAGVLIGVGSLGAGMLVPNTLSSGSSSFPSYPQIAMAARTPGSIVQILCDATTTIGHTLNISSSTVGALTDSGGTTITAQSSRAVALQAVTISSGTALVWAALL